MAKTRKLEFKFDERSMVPVGQLRDLGCEFEAVTLVDAKGDSRVILLPTKMNPVSQ